MSRGAPAPPPAAPEAPALSAPSEGDAALGVLRSLPCMLFILDLLKRKYVYVSRRSLRWFGYPESFAPEQLRMLEHTHPDDRSRIEAALKRAAALEDDETIDVEFRSRPLGGGWRSFLSRISVYRRAADGRAEWIIGVAQDITDRGELEAQLRHAQKMEAVGQLAGGIAHDFNNLLTVILGYAETLSNSLDPEDPTRADAAQIVRAGRRGAALTQQLLASARRQVGEPVLLDLNASYRAVENLLLRLVREDIQVRFEPEQGLHAVRVDPGLIEQILMNLTANARDAMPKGGTLTLSTENVEVVAQDPWQRRGASPGPYVLLSVEDSGVGMPEGVQARIFEPFFTTRPLHGGTGLGLSVVYGIVRQAGGYIAVHSAPGAGARFDMLLPAVAGGGEPVPAPSDTPTRAHGLETVLLVEDDADVRRLAREGLEAHGYHVLEAATGEDALLLARQFDRRIHVAVTDLVLPGMGGSAFATMLTRQYPQTRILIASGYAVGMPFRHGSIDRGWALLRKPFTPAALARAVRRALKPPPASP